MRRSMDQLPTMCTSVILLATSAPRSVRITWWSMARVGTTRLTSEAIGSAVPAPMDSARPLQTIGTWALASDSATDYGSESGLNHGGVHTDGDGITITITITSVSITSIFTIIGNMALPI